MLIGYARVSTQDQNLDLQQIALKNAGCEKLYEDQLSGLKADRPGLKSALEDLRKGDTLVVLKLDRLGRSIKNLIYFVSTLEEKDVHFKSLTDNIDTSHPMGRFFFHIMASIAQMERDLIAERTKAGLIAARARGKIGGRKRKMTPSKIESAQKLLSDGIPPKEVANNLGVSVPTLYRWVPADRSPTQNTNNEI